MTRLEMLKWIHETLGEFKDPELLSIETPSGWEWSNGIFRPTSPDYQAIYSSDYCAYVNSSNYYAYVNNSKTPEVKK